MNVPLSRVPRSKPHVSIFFLVFFLAAARNCITSDGGRLSVRKGGGPVGSAAGEDERECLEGEEEMDVAGGARRLEV